MTDKVSEEVPEGASVFPPIPEELNVHPLLLALLHATVFLAGSDEKVVNTEAATEALEYIGASLQRLQGPELARVRLDLETLAGFARQEKWAKEAVQFLKDFLLNFGVDYGEEAE